jgi:hypothetical protein
LHGLYTVIIIIISTMSGSKKRRPIAHVEGMAATRIGPGAHKPNVPPRDGRSRVVQDESDVCGGN